MANKGRKGGQSSLVSLLVSVAIAIILYLIPNKTQALTAVLLTALGSCLFVSIFKTIWLENANGKLIRRFLAAGAILLCVSVFGWYVWPSRRRPEVRPGIISFSGEFPGLSESNEFTISNPTDVPLYMIEFDFTIKAMSTQDFAIDYPYASLGPSNFSRASDTIALNCEAGRVMVLSIERLAAHESREVYVKEKKPQKATVSAKVGYFTSVPQPIQFGGNSAARFVTFSGAKTCKVGPESWQTGPLQQNARTN